MNQPTAVTNDYIKEALSEQMRLIPPPQEECIKSSWQKVAQALIPASRTKLQ